MKIISMKILSGGQTGVDRAALDTAMALGLPCGGWCPRGRRAEDGPIAEAYPLQETPTEDYPPRTEWNVRDADGTLILTRDTPDSATLDSATLDRGTALTVRLANQQGKPLYVVDLARPADDEVNHVRRWLAEQQIAVLNIAGPRESSAPGIHRQASAFLRALLGSLAHEPEA